MESIKVWVTPVIPVAGPGAIRSKLEGLDGDAQGPGVTAGTDGGALKGCSRASRSGKHETRPCGGVGQPGWQAGLCKVRPWESDDKAR